jgi:hypothetical protein
MSKANWQGYKTHADMTEFHNRINKYAYQRLKAEHELAELRLMVYKEGNFKSEGDWKRY